jgi:hypothetical protein
LHANALPYLAVARVQGPDAAAFLQAQLSADIASLPGGGATFACYCSPRGQVHGLLLVCREPNGPGEESAETFLLAGAAGLLPSILERLRRFVLRARVTLEMAGDLAVCGPPAATAPAAGLYSTLPGLAYRIAEATQCAPDGRAAAAWKAQELRHGIAWLDATTSERFIPQMLGFDRLGAVSFSKGCYPGQEIVARARYLGSVKRKPLRLLVVGAPEIPPGSAVRLLQAADAGNGNWLDGTAIDSAAGGAEEQTVVLVVAAVSGGSVTSLEYAARSYFCATM